MNSIENEKLQQMNTPNGGYRLKEAVKAMINYGSPILVQFPRVEKYGLAKRIRETMYDMLHLCNVIQKKYYKRDTLREFDTLLLDLRDYLDEAANPRLYPQGTEPKKKRKKRADGQAPEATPQPVTCITMHQYATWSKYTGAIGGISHRPVNGGGWPYMPRVRKAVNENIQKHLCPGGGFRQPDAGALPRQQGQEAPG